MYVATPIRDTNVFNGSFHSKLRLIYEPSEGSFDQNSAAKLCATAVRSSRFESLPGTFARGRCGRAVSSIGNARHSRGVFTPGVRKNTQPVLTHDLSNF